MGMQPIDKASSIPYYLQLSDALKREISEREPLDQVYQLPSENELAALHGITRATVRHALDVLERDGWIYREKGKGSFAAVRRVEHELTQLVSTTEAMRERGWSLITRVVSLEEMETSPKIAHALEVAEGAPCYKLRRLRIIEGVPTSLQDSYLPVVLCPGLQDHDLRNSLYRLLESHYGLRLWTGREILRARCSLEHEQELLGVPRYTPLMYMERVTYAVTGEAVEHLEAVWRGDRYDFTVALTRPQS
jgi:GntR family transcriptional regulator